MTSVSETKTVDITRWNRKERRKLKGVKIPGRNLPYQKALHGKLENYYKKREEETKQDGKTN